MFRKLRDTLRSSLKYRIALVFLLTALLPLIILDSVNIYKNYQNSREIMIDNSRSYVQQVKNNVEDRLYSLEMSSMTAIIDRRLRSTLESDLSGGHGVTSIDKTLEANQFLARIDIQNSYIWAVTLITTTDIYYRFKDETTYDVLFRSQYRNMGWYKDSIEKAGQVSVEGVHAPYQATASSAKVISVARSIFDSATRDYWGTILIDVKVNFFQSICNNDSSDGGNFIELVDENNELICAGSNAPAYDKNRTTALAQKIGIHEYEPVTLSDGKQYVVVSALIPKTGWKVFRYISREYLFRYSIQSLWLGILLAFVSFLFIILGSFWLIRTILRPINQLNSEFRRLGTGDFSHSAVSNNPSADEIGQLVGSFTLMKQDLNDLVNRLSTVMSRQKEAELNALQKQIKPHFIYNTLNSIQMLAVMEGAETAASMIQDFAELFRISVERGDLIVSLREEAEHVKRYMNIQKFRYGEKMEYYDEIDPSLLDYRIIRFTLQPIVENAVTHGLEGKMESGHVRLYSRENDDTITVIVEDDGVGINESALRMIQSQMNRDDLQNPHVGLVNVHKRLQNYFGEQYGLSISSKQGAGTVVEIHFPKIMAVPADTDPEENSSPGELL